MRTWPAEPYLAQVRSCMQSMHVHRGPLSLQMQGRPQVQPASEMNQAVPAVCMYTLPVCVSS